MGGRRGGVSGVVWVEGVCGRRGGVSGVVWEEGVWVGGEGASKWCGYVNKPRAQPYHSQQCLSSSI